MATVLENILTKTIPYTVGGKSVNPIPLNINLSLDTEFKKTLIKSVGILSIGIALGIGAGIVISNKKRR